MVRDYQTVVDRLRALPRRDWRVTVAGEVWGYPVFTVRRVVSANAPLVFLTGGMHGEEPAGVEGVLRWLERGPRPTPRVNWLVIPCINPYGWERNQRTNAQRRDINRHFRRRDDTPEAALIRRIVAGRRFWFSMEFHEDVDASGYYLYEAHRHGPLIGEAVVRSVRGWVPINRDRLIDGHEASAVGLIRRALDDRAMRKRRRWPMAYQLYLRHTDQVFGSETPVTVPLAKRAEAHCRALATVLRNA